MSGSVRLPKCTWGAQPARDSAQPTDDMMIRRRLFEMLAEYGWKPHQELLTKKQQIPAQFEWYTHGKLWGTVLSNSKHQTVLVQQYSANLSLLALPTNRWSEAEAVPWALWPLPCPKGNHI